MFGYVRPREDGRELFCTAYCGLCHSLGRRYGFPARFLLNFDFTFLSILLSDGRAVSCGCLRCAAHPFRGRRALPPCVPLDTAADYSVILTWWQLRDHIADSGRVRGLKYRFAALLIRRAYRKARGRAPSFDALVRARLGELAAREAERCASLDAAAEPFAALMAAMAEAEPDETKRRVLRHILYHLGRWIYLIDAADDFGRDRRDGCYNPLRYRYGADGETLPEEDRRALAETLDASVRQMAGAYALWDYGIWTPVLDGIFYESFYGIGKAVLDGTYRKPSRATALRGGRKNREEPL